MEILGLDFGGAVDNDITGDCDVCMAFPVEYPITEEAQKRRDAANEGDTADDADAASVANGSEGRGDRFVSEQLGKPEAAPDSLEDEEEVSYTCPGDDCYKKIDFSKQNPRYLTNLTLRKDIPKSFFDHPDCVYMLTRMEATADMVGKRIGGRQKFNGKCSKTGADLVAECAD